MTLPSYDTDLQSASVKVVQEQLDSLDAFMVKVKEIVTHLQAQTDKMSRSIGSIADEFCSEDLENLIDALVLRSLSMPTICLRREYKNRAARLQTITSLIKNVDLLMFALRDEVEK